MASVKDAFLRLIELSLYGHGVLHFVEVGFALYEEAYICLLYTSDAADEE